MSVSLTEDEIKVFWTEEEHMKFSADAIEVFIEEVTSNPWELLDFNRETIKSMANMISHQKGDKVPHSDPVQAEEGRTMTKPTSMLGDTYQMRIAKASKTVRCHETVNRKITANKCSGSPMLNISSINGKLWKEGVVKMIALKLLLLEKT